MCTRYTEDLYQRRSVQQFAFIYSTTEPITIKNATGNKANPIETTTEFVTNKWSWFPITSY
jgi:hypothetical protein